MAGKRVGCAIAIAVVAASLAALVLASGCGGEGRGGLSAREQSMQSTLEGSYQVKGTEDGVVKGVGIYDNGSFRIIVEDAPRIIIHNRESGESWLVSLTLKTCEPITYDDAVVRTGFMPATVMKPYFDLQQFWGEDMFQWDTADGRSIRVFLDGPGGLPSRWEAEARGSTFKAIDWEYRRVGAVSPANFQPPEGLIPKDEL